MRVLVCVRVRRVRAVCGTAHRCAGDVRVRASVCVCTRARVSAVCVCAQCACVRCVCARRCAHVRLRRCADGCMCACCATARLRVLARVHAHVGVRACMHMRLRSNGCAFLMCDLSLGGHHCLSPGLGEARPPRMGLGWGARSGWLGGIWEHTHRHEFSHFRLESWFRHACVNKSADTACT